MIRWAMSLALFATAMPVAAMADDLEAPAFSFREAFVASECLYSDGSIMPDCNQAVAGILRYLEQVRLMRSSCPHPLYLSRFVDLAYGCAQATRAHNAGGTELHQGFVDTFNRDNNPSSEHYCASEEMQW